MSTHSARETLNMFKKEKTLTLAERLEHNMQGQYLPTMNLHVFLNHLYGEVMDALLQMFMIDENDTIKIGGLGVFRGDKFQLSLTQDQSLLFSVLEDKQTKATFTFDMEHEKGKEYIAARGFRSISKWDWDQKEKQLFLNLHLEWTLTQYPQRFNIEKTEDVTKIKKIIVEKLEQELNELFTLFKENEVDPRGIGSIVRSQDRTWEKESFYELYPTLPIHLNVDLQ